MAAILPTVVLSGELSMTQGRWGSRISASVNYYCVMMTAKIKSSPAAFFTSATPSGTSISSFNATETAGPNEFPLHNELSFPLFPVSQFALLHPDSDSHFNYVRAPIEQCRACSICPSSEQDQIATESGRLSPNPGLEAGLRRRRDFFLLQ
jgi:hypothetical protein